MGWVCGVVRGAGGLLRLKLVNEDGWLETADLAGMGSAPTFHLAGETTCRKGTFELCKGTRTTADAYLQSLGFSVEYAGGQAVYEFNVDGLVWMVPSQLLVLSILGSQRALRELLFRPVPASGVAEILTGTVRTSTGQTLRVLEASPTAQMSWGSVYRNALEGRLDLTLPNFSVSMSARGKLRGNRLLVTKLHLVSLWDDGVGGHAASEGTSPSSNKLVSLRKKRAYAGTSALSNWTVSSRLTDLQWAAIRPLAERTADGPKTGRKRLHDLRSTTELMMTKLAGRLGWGDLKGDPKQVVAAVNLYRNLKRRQHLEQVCRIAAVQ